MQDQHFREGSNFQILFLSLFTIKKQQGKKSAAGTFSFPQQPIQRGILITRDYSLLLPVCRNAIYSLSSMSELTEEVRQSQLDEPEKEPAKVRKGLENEPDL